MNNNKNLRKKKNLEGLPLLGKKVTVYEVIHLFNELVTDVNWLPLLDTRNIYLP